MPRSLDRLETGHEIQAEPAGERDDVADAAARGIAPDDHALGRLANAPGDIPRRGWWAVLRRVGREAASDDVGMVAAGCGFYALLALFPAISILISLYGLVFDPAEVEGQLQGLRGVLPHSAYEMIATRTHDVVLTASSKLTWGLVISVLVALWGAMNGTKAVIAALNLAYEEQEKRSFWRLNLTALLFTLGGIFGVTIALSIIVGLPAALSFAWLGPLADLGVRAASFALLVGFVVLGLSILYRFAPSRREAKWRWVTPGSILAAVLWLVASVLFSFYVSNFGSYDVTYGSVGAVVVLLLWFYISAFVVILGAELNAELELQTKRDTTHGGPRQMGQRGAFVADHVAVAG